MVNGPVAVVYNPIKRDVERTRRVVDAASRERGFGDPIWLPTTLQRDGGEMARQALESHPGLIIAAGGDGTVRTVAGAVRHSGVPLAVIPSGTGNMLARAIGVPTGKPEAAAALAFDGRERVIDMGEAEIPTRGGKLAHHPFTVMAGIGLDATMIENTSDTLKARLGWLAYLDAGLRSLPKAKPSRIRYQLDSGAEDSRLAHSIVIGNVGSLPGKINLIPEAALDDGELDVAVIHPKSFFDWVNALRTVMTFSGPFRHTHWAERIRTFRSRHFPNVLSYARGRSVTVRTEQMLPAELDGDSIGPVRWARFSIDPGSLLVRGAPVDSSG